MFLEKNRDRIEKDFEDFSRELPGKAEEIKKRMEALSPGRVSCWLFFLIIKRR